MSYAADNVYDDVDPDDAIAMEEARYQALLKDHGERRAIIKAIHDANDLEREIAGEMPGLILAYLRETQEVSIKAMATLMATVGMTDEDRFAAQLKIQPYAHLMKWLKDKAATSRAMKVSLEDLDRHLDGQVED